MKILPRVLIAMVYKETNKKKKQNIVKLMFWKKIFFDVVYNPRG